MTNKIVVLSTCSGEEEAERIAKALVESRTAACVNIVPGAKSVFWWQGAIESANECLLVIKSTRELFAALQRTLEKVHSYEIPEIIAVQVVDGSANYLKWIDGSVRA
jgi:periplasmic divalent cation tolerance protein